MTICKMKWHLKIVYKLQLIDNFQMPFNFTITAVRTKLGILSQAVLELIIITTFRHI